MKNRIMAIAAPLWSMATIYAVTTILDVWKDYQPPVKSLPVYIISEPETEHDH
jgi:hypothetical protein